jgi:hypothetical protein
MSDLVIKWISKPTIFSEKDKKKFNSMSKFLTPEIKRITTIEINKGIV